MSPNRAEGLGKGPGATSEGGNGVLVSGCRELGLGGPRGTVDTHINWMTLFKPSISYRLSVSEPPSSKDSLPGDEKETEPAFWAPLGWTHGKDPRTGDPWDSGLGVAGIPLLS